MRSETLYLTDIVDTADAIAVHDYFGVNWETARVTATQDVPTLREQVMPLLGQIKPDSD